VSTLRTLRRAILDALPEPLSKIIRCIGAPNKFIHFPDPTYAQDGLVTRHNADFMRDPLFASAYALGKATGSWPGGEPAWRTYVACWAAHKAISLEGDFVECGVNRGGMSRAICQYVGFEKLPKLFWLLDTYHGLSDELINEEERSQGRTNSQDYYTECLGAVRETFKAYPNARIVQAAAKRFGIADERIYMNIEEYANTSAASIPIALDEMSRKGLLAEGDLVMAMGFGAGLTNGGVIIRW